MTRVMIGASLIVLAGALPACGSSNDGAGDSGSIFAPSPSPSPTPSPSPDPSPSPSPSPTPSPTATGPLALTGNTAPVHDPAILKDDGEYYLFVTGNVGDAEGLLATRTSADLHDWSLNGPVFDQIPAWAKTAIPDTGGLWAPDISKRHGEYRLYYSVSSFGSNHSAIGLATKATLDSTDPQDGWTDKGEAVIESQTSDDYNAIDPNVFDDDQGREWMVFGSFFAGIKMIQLDPDTGMRLEGDTTVHAVAQRPSPDAIEGPYVFHRGDYYYLFASFDFCCRGADSTYYTVVGRSTDPTGPYVDKDGTPMLDGGGTQVLASGQGTGDRYVGRGHVAVFDDGDSDYIVYHAYDTAKNGFPTLRIRALAWDEDGWPVAQ